MLADLNLNAHAFLTGIKAIVETRDQSLIRALSVRGAEIVDDINTAQIVITSNEKSAYSELAEPLGIPIVLENWAYESLRFQVIQNTCWYSIDPRKIFAGLKFSCSAEILKSDRHVYQIIITLLGGQCALELGKRTTHVLALSTNDTLFDKAKRHPKLQIKLVNPHWLTQCLCQQRKIIETEVKFDHSISNDSKSRDVQVLAIKSHLFSEKRLFFQFDGISEDLVSNIIKLAESHGGKIVLNLHEANILIVEDQLPVTKAHIVCGNLLWFLSIIAKNTWIDPDLCISFLPKFEIAVSGFEDKILSISNYLGNFRAYLENLCVRTGSRYERNFTPQNWVLIAASKKGDKVAAAEKWNIPIVNHLWLEDSLRNNQQMLLSDKKYLIFSERKYAFNKRALDLEIGPKSEALKSNTVQENYVKCEESNELKIPDLESKTSQKGKNWDHQEKQIDECHNTKIIKTNFEDELLDTVSRDFCELTEKSSEQLEGENEEGSKQSFICRNENSNNIENEEPVKHDTRAIRKTDRKRKINSQEQLLISKSMQSDANTTAANLNSKAITNFDSYESVFRNTKISRVHRRLQVKVACTNLENELNKTVLKKLEAIGIKVVDDALANDVLCSSKYVRTAKFLCAVARRIPIVEENWLKSSIKNKSIADVQMYLLVDKDTEKKFNFSLLNLLPKRKPIFENYLLVFTPGTFTTSSKEQIQQIVNLNGGQSKFVVKKQKFDFSQDLIMISTLDDKKLWPLNQSFNKEKRGLVYSKEWFITMCLMQKLDWNSDERLF